MSTDPLAEDLRRLAGQLHEGSELEVTLRHAADVLEELERLRSRFHYPKERTMEDRMLKWFEYQHLPETLQSMSRLFHDVAHAICLAAEPGPERTVALRKLLEAKDAAVRARVHPGG